MNNNVLGWEIVKGGLRTLAQANPWFAGLATAWSEAENHFQNERIRSFFQILGRDMLRVKERIIALESKLATSKDFPVLVERVVEKIRRESSNRKVSLFATLLTNSMTADEAITHEDKLNFIETLDTLTDYDVEILNYFVVTPHLRLTLLIDEFQFDRYPVTSKEAEDAREKLSRIITAISKLEARGIISQSYSTGGDVRDSAGDHEHWINRWRYRYYQLLPYGEKFIQALIEAQDAPL